MEFKSQICTTIEQSKISRNIYDDIIYLLTIKINNNLIEKCYIKQKE